MQNKKFLIAGFILAVAIIGLTFNTALKTSATHMRPSRFKELSEKNKIRKGAAIKLTGTVVKGSVDKSAGKLAFKITDKKSQISIVYEGTIPDAFAEGRDVIIDGAYTDGEPFIATQLSTKCPSKYEENKKKRSGK